MRALQRRIDGKDLSRRSKLFGGQGYKAGDAVSEVANAAGKLNVMATPSPITPGAVMLLLAA